MESLTTKQEEQLDYIHNAMYVFICNLAGKELEWDMEWIGEAIDGIMPTLERVTGLTELELYPYIIEESS